MDDQGEVAEINARRIEYDNAKKRQRQKSRLQQKLLCQAHTSAHTGTEALVPMDRRAARIHFKNGEGGRRNVSSICEEFKNRDWNSKEQLKLAESELNEFAGKIVTRFSPPGKHGPSGYRLRDDTGVLRSGCGLVDPDETCDYDLYARQKNDGKWNVSLTWHTCTYSVHQITPRFPSTAYSSQQLAPILVKHAMKGKDLNMPNTKSVLAGYLRLAPTESLCKNTIKKARLALKGKLGKAAGKLPALASEAKKLGHGFKVNFVSLSTFFLLALSLFHHFSLSVPQTW